MQSRIEHMRYDDSGIASLLDLVCLVFFVLAFFAIDGFTASVTGRHDRRADPQLPLTIE